MKLERMRAKIETGALGIVASLVGFVNLFVPVLLSLYWTEPRDSQQQFLGVIYFVSVGMLWLGSMSGVVVSFASLMIRRTRLAWLGLLLGFVALLFVPTYLLPVFSGTWHGRNDF
jgi:hypothetical protein